MRSQSNSTSPSTHTLDNAFAPAYLARLRERDEVLTSAPGLGRVFAPPVPQILR